MTYRIGLYLSFFVLSQAMASDSEEADVFYFSSHGDSEEDSSVEPLQNVLVITSTTNQPSKTSPCDEESMASEQRETGAWTKKEYDDIVNLLLDDNGPSFLPITPVASRTFEIPEPAKHSISSESKTGSQSARAPKSVYSPRPERLTRSSGGLVLQRKKSAPIEIYKKESPCDGSPRSFSPRQWLSRKSSKGSGSK